ncbi:MAG: ABC transporter ATP-binding protein [Phormidesmis sp.]
MYDLRIEGITKRFGSFVANDSIDLNIASGSIHAVLGENGAGKTTLMNILSGLLQPDAGQIYLNEQSVEISSSQQAIALGIGMIHQHFMLIPTLSVTENILLGTATGGRLHSTKRAAEIAALGEKYGLVVPPNALIEDLPVGIQQRVEILKVLYRQARVLILDEPTAVLAPAETASLLGLLRQLATLGHTIVFISHKLDEVMSVSDHVTVLRQGSVVGTVLAQETSRQALAKWMVGREVNLQQKTATMAAEPREIRLSVRDLQIANSLVQRLSFDLSAREILGIAGVEGNGQRELADAVAGIVQPEQGSITIGGEQASRRVGYIPEDRQKMGLILSFSVAKNLILKAFRWLPFAKWGLFRQSAIKQRGEEAIAAYDIRAAHPALPVGSLSGGNQQKVILARELSGAPALIVAMQPTRGLDIGATQYVQEQLLKCRAGGAAILYISSELEEVIAMSDRIAVMYEGAFVDILEANTATAQQIGLLMTGGNLSTGSSKVQQ